MMSNDPPLPNTPEFSVFCTLGFAEPRSSTLTNFSGHVTHLRVLGSAQPTIPWDAN